MTLEGYADWVFRRLVEYRGERIGTVGTYIIQRWIDDNAEFLARFNITHDQWELEKKGGTRIDFPPQPSRE